MKPTIIVGCGSGYHNENLEEAIERLQSAQQYKNCNTVILTPTRGMISAQVVQSWLFLIGPANAKLGRLFCQGFEVAAAYNSGITTVINDPIMSDAKYLCTLEDDNIPPHEGLLRLYENICSCEVPCKEHYVVVSGLYFTKGEMGQPMIYGDPKKSPTDFTPQLPDLGPDKQGTIQECNGTGMGFSLFHMGLFKNNLPGIEKPWFATSQTRPDHRSVKLYTQDLYFMERLRLEGYKIACDTRVRVGHFDAETETTW